MYVNLFISQIKYRASLQAEKPCHTHLCHIGSVSHTIGIFRAKIQLDSYWD